MRYYTCIYKLSSGTSVDMDITVVYYGTFISLNYHDKDMDMYTKDYINKMITHASFSNLVVDIYFTNGNPYFNIFQKN